MIMIKINMNKTIKITLILETYNKFKKVILIKVMMEVLKKNKKIKFLIKLLLKKENYFLDNNDFYLWLHFYMFYLSYLILYKTVNFYIRKYRNN